MNKTKIAWTDETWNPIVGCSKISEGCKNCYAEKMAKRLYHMALDRQAYNSYKGQLDAYLDVICPGNFIWNGICQIQPAVMSKPLRWKKPRRIFVNSMGDLFHENVPDEWIGEVSRVMVRCPQHIFQILTKRADRMLKFYEKWQRSGVYGFCDNVWPGVTVESSKYLWRVEKLLQIQAAVRFVSLEPLLSNMRIYDWLAYGLERVKEPYRKLDWVIVGAETGPGRRECKLEWVESIVQQCAEANVPCFVKQIEVNGKISHDMSQWPEHLRVRQWPSPNQTTEHTDKHREKNETTDYTDDTD